ncbi:hypothetical protein BJY52DRAFT_1194043 [Lactarius psammicola]|nr:hypothetical protein BJY52DRAFT_1194043 [Lactarius psammicola]
MYEAALFLYHLKPHYKRPQEPASISSIGDMLRVACELRCALGGITAVPLKGPGGHLRARLADLVSVSGEIGTAGVAVHRVHADTDPLDTEILLRAAGANPGAPDPGPMAAVDVPVVVDVLYSNNTHGRTGYMLRAVLACALARGESLVEAVQPATTKMKCAIATAFPVGSGHKPLNYMSPLLSQRSADRRPRATARNPYPLERTLIRREIGRNASDTICAPVRREHALARALLPYIKQDITTSNTTPGKNGYSPINSPSVKDYNSQPLSSQLLHRLFFSRYRDRPHHRSREHDANVAFASVGYDHRRARGHSSVPACTAYSA